MKRPSFLLLIILAALALPGCVCYSTTTASTPALLETRSALWPWPLRPLHGP